jgi:hypothetical protein
LVEVNGAAATLKVDALALKLGELIPNDAGAEGKVVPILGLTDDQSVQPEPPILVFDGSRISRLRSLRPEINNASQSLPIT